MAAFANTGRWHAVGSSDLITAINDRCAAARPDTLDERQLRDAATGSGPTISSKASFVHDLVSSIRTSPFRKDPQYSLSTSVPLGRPWDDTSAIVGAAIHCLQTIFAPGYKLAKAGVMLLDLAPTTRERFELELGKEKSERACARLMQALDAVNDRWGRGMLKSPVAASARRRATGA
jgi:DNA polymerase V